MEIEKFGRNFEQVFWLTNPSNVNIIAALLEKENIKIPKGCIYFPVIGEYFPESFREQIAKRFGHPIDSPFCLWTGYGSADTGDLGMETAYQNAIKETNKALRNELIEKIPKLKVGLEKNYIRNLKIDLINLGTLPRNPATGKIKKLNDKRVT